MVSLRLAFTLFRKRLVLSLILVVQLAIALVLQQFLVGRLNYTSFALREFRSLSQEPGVFFCPTMTEAALPVGSLRDVKQICSLYYASLDASEGGFPVKIFDDALLEYYQPGVSAGQWLRPSSGEDSAIRVVCTKPWPTLRLGDTIEATLAGESAQAVPVRVRIVGILDAPHIPLDFGIAGNALRAGDLFPPVITEGDVPELLALHSDITRFTTDIHMKSNQLILFRSAQAVEDNRRLMRDYGFVNTLQDMQANEEQAIALQLRVIAPYLGFALAILLVGLVGLSLLNLLQHARVFALYYLVGAGRGACLRIGIAYVSLVLLFSAALAGPATWRLFASAQQTYLEIYATAANAGAVAGTWLSLFLLTTLCVWALFRRFSAIEIIRKMA